MVIFTDGYCNVDFKIYGKHMWILTHDDCNQKYPGPVIKIPVKSWSIKIKKRIYDYSIFLNQQC